MEDGHVFISAVDQDDAKRAIATIKTIVEDPEIGAILLECTYLPPFARRIREELDIPVFDFNSMIGHVAMALSIVKLY